MKVTWSNKEKRQPEREKSESQADVRRISVGHSAAELYIRFDETTLILPPAAGKKLYRELRRAVSDWESEHGTATPAGHGKKRRKESVPKRVLKELYRSRKVGSKLIRIDTGKKRHLPLKDD